MWPVMYESLLFIAAFAAIGALGVFLSRRYGLVGQAYLRKVKKHEIEITSRKLFSTPSGLIEVSWRGTHYLLYINAHCAEVIDCRKINDEE